LLLARERRRIAHPKAQDYADFQVGLQQGFALGEMAVPVAPYETDERVLADRLFPQDGMIGRRSCG
jgi:hypothetical protein